MPLLFANKLTKTYDLGGNKIEALKEIDLKIDSGEFVAIIGKSGSGKSTLMHILGLLDTPTSGELFLNDENVSNMTEKQLAKIRNQEIGFVFQAYNLLPRTTALDNVILPLQYGRTPQKLWKQQAIDMLKMVELGDRLYNKSNELSGGQKQRVAIARALVTNPSLILADEPTGNLDSKTGREIEQLFIELNNNGKTIILVTHDEDLAKITKRKIVLQDGKVIN